MEIEIEQPPQNEKSDKKHGRWIIKVVYHVMYIVQLYNQFYYVRKKKK